MARQRKAPAPDAGALGQEAPLEETGSEEISPVADGGQPEVVEGPEQASEALDMRSMTQDELVNRVNDLQQQQEARELEYQQGFSAQGEELAQLRRLKEGVLAQMNVSRQAPPTQIPRGPSTDEPASTQDYAAYLAANPGSVATVVRMIHDDLERGMGPRVEAAAAAQTYQRQTSDVWSRLCGDFPDLMFQNSALFQRADALARTGLKLEIGDRGCVERAAEELGVTALGQEAGAGRPAAGMTPRAAPGRAPVRKNPAQTLSHKNSEGTPTPGALTAGKLGEMLEDSTDGAYNWLTHPDRTDAEKEEFFRLLDKAQPRKRRADVGR